jgi:K+-sensing histidine kinase KdpD
MSTSSIPDPRIEILKALGHKSRTLLNGITGPVQIIRSLSDDPKLIEPLRLLELSVSRFDKFSFRALLLSDLLRENKVRNPKSFDLIDNFKYIILDLTDLLDFYNVKLELQTDIDSIEIVSDSDLLSHCISILCEQTIALCGEGTTIKVDFNKNVNQVECTFFYSDKGIVYKSLKSIFNTSEYPSDIDLYLFKFGMELLKAKLSTSLSPINQTIFKLELPYTYHHE